MTYYDDSTLDVRRCPHGLALDVTEGERCRNCDAEAECAHHSAMYALAIQRAREEDPTRLVLPDWRVWLVAVALWIVGLSVAAQLMGWGP